MRDKTNTNSRNYVFFMNWLFFFPLWNSVFISDNVFLWNLLSVPASIWLVFAWISFSNHLLSNLCIFIFKVCVSYKQHISRSFIFITTAAICLLTRAPNILTFTENIHVFKSPIVLFSICSICIFVSLFPPFLCPSRWIALFLICSRD